MSQFVVFSLLKHHEKGLSSEQISKKLCVSSNSVNANLFKLFKSDLISRKQVLGKTNHYHYLYKTKKVSKHSRI